MLTLISDTPYAFLIELAFATTLSKLSFTTLSLEKVACKKRWFA